jgi:hypothetical protein
MNEILINLANNNIQVHNGAQSKYYIVQGIKYHINFPLEWALNNNPCVNCLNHTINGMFVYYCQECCQQRHEKISHNPDTLELWVLPYMVGISIEDIGDDEILKEITDERIRREKYLYDMQFSILHDELEENNQNENVNNEDNWLNEFLNKK